MLPWRPTASDALVEGYRVTADLAAKRREQVAAIGDQLQVRAWERVESYCRMMADCRMVDDPDSPVNYLPLDERIIDRRVLSEIMQDADEGVHRQWTTYHQMAYTAAMALLSPMERAVAEMYYGAQMKRVDIAEALRLSAVTVDNYILRSRKKWAKLRQVDEM